MAALFIFGAGMGSLDCVVNIQAVIVERASRRPMMSGFHGLFSVGGIVGSGGVSAAAQTWERRRSRQRFAWRAPSWVCWSKPLHTCSRMAAKAEGSVFAIPHGPVLFIGILCFAVFLTEAAVLDWSAVFLTSTRGVEPSLRRASPMPRSPEP